MHELHSWLSRQNSGLETFRIFQRKLDEIAAAHPGQRALCRLLNAIVGRYVAEFDEAPLPSVIAERALQRLTAALAALDPAADATRQLDDLNRLAELDLTM